MNNSTIDYIYTFNQLLSVLYNLDLSNNHFSTVEECELALNVLTPILKRLQLQVERMGD